MQAHRGTRLPDRQVDEAGREPVRRMPAPGLATSTLTGTIARTTELGWTGSPRVSSQARNAPAIGREDHVVDGDVVGVGAAGQPRAHLAVVVEVGPDHDEPAGRADLDVERRGGSRAGGRRATTVETSEPRPCDDAPRDLARPRRRPPRTESTTWPGVEHGVDDARRRPARGRCGSCRGRQVSTTSSVEPRTVVDDDAGRCRGR